MSDQKLRIEIETSATGSGIPQTATGIEKVASSAQKAAPAMDKMAQGSKATAQELGRGVEIGNAAVATLTSIASSGQGGAAGLIAVARAGFSAGTMFKGLLASMGPVGIAAAAIGIALGLISAALRKSEESAAKARAEIDKLNQQKLDLAVEEQNKLKRAAEEAYRALKAEAAAKEEVADSELARRKSDVIADAKETGEDPSVTERKLRALERQREDEKRANALKLANDEADLRAKAQKDLEASAKKAADDLAAAEARRAAVTAAEQKLAAIKSENTSGSYGMSLNGSAERDRALAELEKAKAAAAADTDKRVEDLKGDSEAKKKDAESAARDTAQARADAELLRKTQAAITPKLQETRANEDRAAREPTSAEKAAAEKARAEQDVKIRRIPAAVWNNRIASGDTSVDIEALKRNYPAYKFQTRAAAPGAPMTPPTLDPSPAAPGQPRLPNTVQRGGGALPSDGGASGLPKGITEIKKSADSMESTLGKAADQKLPDFKPAADSAETLSKNLEAFAKQSTEQIGALVSTMTTAAGTAQTHAAAIASLEAKIRTLQSQFAAARSKH